MVHLKKNKELLKSGGVVYSFTLGRRQRQGDVGLKPAYSTNLSSRIASECYTEKPCLELSPVL